MSFAALRFNRLLSGADELGLDRLVSPKIVVVSVATLQDAIEKSRDASSLGSLLQPTLKPGDVVSATVIARAEGQAHIVQIANHKIKLELPRTILPGTAFQIRAGTIDSNSLQDSISSHHAPKTDQYVDLSATGRFVARLLVADPVQSALPATHTQPIAAATAMPLAFARALQDAVEQSGMFYESHLTSWVAGQFDLTDLRREPQANLTSSTGLGQLEVSKSDHAQETIDSKILPPLTVSETAFPGVVDEALPLVRSQLEMLATNSGLWRVEIGPNQFADISIQEEHRNDSGGHQERGWRVGLHLSMPLLGPVSASLSLAANALDVILQTHSPSSELSLNTTKASFSQALESAGLNLQRFEVRSDAAE